MFALVHVVAHVHASLGKTRLKGYLFKQNPTGALLNPHFKSFSVFPILSLRKS